jgi:signal transduction histidine kinase
VTDVERQRRQIQRRQAQFDDFADAITHELRNTLNIVRGVSKRSRRVWTQTRTGR